MKWAKKVFLVLLLSIMGIVCYKSNAYDDIYLFMYPDDGVTGRVYIQTFPGKSETNQMVSKLNNGVKEFGKVGSKIPDVGKPIGDICKAIDYVLTPGSVEYLGFDSQLQIFDLVSSGTEIGSPLPYQDSPHIRMTGFGSAFIFIQMVWKGTFVWAGLEIADQEDGPLCLKSFSCNPTGIIVPDGTGVHCDPGSIKNAESSALALQKMSRNRYNCKLKLTDVNLKEQESNVTIYNTATQSSLQPVRLSINESDIIWSETSSSFNVGVKTQMTNSPLPGVTVTVTAPSFMYYGPLNSMPDNLKPENFFPLDKRQIAEGYVVPTDVSFVAPAILETPSGKFHIWLCYGYHEGILEYIKKSSQSTDSDKIMPDNYACMWIASPDLLNRTYTPITDYDTSYASLGDMLLKANGNNIELDNNFPKPLYDEISNEQYGEYVHIDDKTLANAKEALKDIEYLEQQPYKIQVGIEFREEQSGTLSIEVFGANDYIIMNCLKPKISLNDTSIFGEYLALDTDTTKDFFNTENGRNLVQFPYLSVPSIKEDFQSNSSSQSFSFTDFCLEQPIVKPDDHEKKVVYFSFSPNNDISSLKDFNIIFYPKTNEEEVILDETQAELDEGDEEAELKDKQKIINDEYFLPDEEGGHVIHHISIDSWLYKDDFVPPQKAESFFRGERYGLLLNYELLHKLEDNLIYGGNTEKKELIYDLIHNRTTYDCKIISCEVKTIVPPLPDGEGMTETICFTVSDKYASGIYANECRIAQDTAWTKETMLSDLMGNNSFYESGKNYSVSFNLDKDRDGNFIKYRYPWDWASYYDVTYKSFTPDSSFDKPGFNRFLVVNYDYADKRGGSNRGSFILEFDYEKGHGLYLSKEWGIPDWIDVDLKKNIIGKNAEGFREYTIRILINEPRLLTHQDIDTAQQHQALEEKGKELREKDEAQKEEYYATYEAKAEKLESLKDFYKKNYKTLNRDYNTLKQIKDNYTKIQERLKKIKISPKGNIDELIDYYREKSQQLKDDIQQSRDDEKALKESQDQQVENDKEKEELQRQIEEQQRQIEELQKQVEEQQRQQEEKKKKMAEIKKQLEEKKISGENIGVVIEDEKAKAGNENISEEKIIVDSDNKVN